MILIRQRLIIEQRRGSSTPVPPVSTSLSNNDGILIQIDNGALVAEPIAFTEATPHDSIATDGRKLIVGEAGPGMSPIVEGREGGSSVDSEAGLNGDVVALTERIVEAEVNAEANAEVNAEATAEASADVNGQEEQQGAKGDGKEEKEHGGKGKKGKSGKAKKGKKGKANGTKKEEEGDGNGDSDSDETGQVKKNAGTSRENLLD